MLRDGIEEYEKIRWLRKQKARIVEIEKVLKTYDFKRNHDNGYEALRDQVTATREAIEASAKRCK